MSDQTATHAPETFRPTPDHRLVFNLRETGRWRKGEPELENDIAICIEVNPKAGHPPGTLERLANLIADTLNTIGD